MTTTIAKPKKKVAKKAAPTKKAASTKPSSTNTGQRSVGVRELRQSASQILDQVKAGAIIEITEHGVPVARLVPIARSRYQEYLAAGLIIPARNPNRVFEVPKGKVSKGKQLSEILIEERRAARF